MEAEELLSKLDLIEEQARRSRDEYPHPLAKERQRMIIALVKQLRWEIADARPEAGQDPETTVRLPS